MDCPRKYKSIYCHHCDKEVSKSTWYSHYGLYFDQRTEIWIKCSTSNSDTTRDVSADFNFGSSGSDTEIDDIVEYIDTRQGA